MFGRSLKFATIPREDLELCKGLYKTVYKTAKYLCTKYGIETDDLHAILAVPDESDCEIAELNRRIDVALTFMRRVFWFCFAGNVLGTFGKPLRNGIEFVRRFQSKLVVIDEGAAESGDERGSSHTAAEAIRKFVSRHSVEKPKPVIAKDDPIVDVAEYTQSLIKCETEGERYRCASCEKLFKGPEFVEKHISLKHQSDLDAWASRQLLWHEFQSCVGGPNADETFDLDDLLAGRMRAREWVTTFFNSSYSGEYSNGGPSGGPHSRSNSGHSQRRPYDPRGEFRSPSQGRAGFHKQSMTLEPLSSPPQPLKGAQASRRISNYADLDDVPSGEANPSGIC